MKNFTKCFGIIACAAIIGFLLAGCSTDDSGSGDAYSFSGYWTGNVINEGYTYDIVLVADSTLWVAAVEGYVEALGTYARLGSKVTFKQGNTTMGDASLINNKLSIVITDAGMAGTYTFTRQPIPANPPIAGIWSGTVTNSGMNPASAPVLLASDGVNWIMGIPAWDFGYLGLVTAISGGYELKEYGGDDGYGPLPGDTLAAAAIQDDTLTVTMDPINGPFSGQVTFTKN